MEQEPYRDFKTCMRCGKDIYLENYFCEDCANNIIKKMFNTDFIHEELSKILPPVPHIIAKMISFPYNNNETKDGKNGN